MLVTGLPRDCNLRRVACITFIKLRCVVMLYHSIVVIYLYMNLKSSVGFHQTWMNCSFSSCISRRIILRCIIK